MESVSGRVETSGGQVIQFSKVKPVKWSEVDKKIGNYRDGFVDCFLMFEGRPLLDDEGASLRDGRNRPLRVTMVGFAVHNGISTRSFKRWVFERRGYSSHPNSRPQQDRGHSGREPCDEHQWVCTRCHIHMEGGDQEWATGTSR
jgi:hypothetical protein